MLNLEIGQEWKFVHSVSVDGHTIPSGTRVRVGAILSEVVEPKVTVVVLNQEPVEALTIAFEEDCHLCACSIPGQSAGLCNSGTLRQ